METLMWNVLTVSAKMTVVLLPVLLLSPLLDRTYAAKWKVFIYVLLGIRLLIPFSISLPSAPLQVAAPQQAFERPVLLWSAPSDPVKSRTFTEEQSQSAQTSQPGQAAVQTPQSRTGRTRWPSRRTACRHDLGGGRDGIPAVAVWRICALCAQCQKAQRAGIKTAGGRLRTGLPANSAAPQSDAARERSARLAHAAGLCASRIALAARGVYKRGAFLYFRP